MLIDVDTNNSADASESFIVEKLLSRFQVKYNRLLMTKMRRSRKVTQHKDILPVVQKTI